MADELVKRRDLVPRLNSLSRRDWKRIAINLGLVWDERHGKGSHCVIRDPKYPDPADIRGLMATVQKKLYLQANRNIFRNLVRRGIAEDDIWRILGFLK